MQIKTLHKNMYRFYAWARTQECTDAYRKEIEESVWHWESLQVEGVSTIKCAEFTGSARHILPPPCAVEGTYEGGSSAVKGA